MKKQVKSIFKYSKVAAALSLSLSAMALANPAQAMDFSAGGWKEVTIDFDEYTKSNGSVQSLAPGTVIRNQWKRQYGLTVEAEKSDGSTGYAVIFDSDCKEYVQGDCSGGDPDLATGVGNVNGSILDTEGNVLILQENTDHEDVAKYKNNDPNERINRFTTPDDDRDGGKLTFKLDLGRLQSSIEDSLGYAIQGLEARWSTVRFIDIDSNPTAENVDITVTGQSGSSNTKSVRELVNEAYENGADPVLFAGIDPDKEFSDNSVLDVNVSNIILNEDAKKLEVDYDGSGAIAALSLYYRYDTPPQFVPTPAAVMPVLGSLFGCAAKRKKKEKDESTNENNLA